VEQRRKPGRGACADRTLRRRCAGLSYALTGIDNAPYVKYYGTGVKPDQVAVRTISGLKTTDRETSGQIDASTTSRRGGYRPSKAACGSSRPASTPRVAA
jgi:hypothetical protein